MSRWKRSRSDEDFVAYLRRRPLPHHQQGTLDYMERLQKAAYESWQQDRLLLDRQTAGISIDDVRRIDPRTSQREWATLDAYTREILDLLREPTEFEGPGMHFLLQTLVARVERELPGLEGRSISDDTPVFGLTMSGQATAKTYLAPQTREHIVLVDQELFLFLNLMGKIVAQALPGEIVMDDDEELYVPTKDREVVREHLRSDRRALVRFLDVIQAYAISGRASAASAYMLPGGQQELARSLTFAGELFVVSHEYSHALLGHLRDPISNRGPADHPDVSETLWGTTQECLADSKALPPTTRALERQGYDSDLLPAFTLARWGCDLYLYSFAMLKRALGTLRSGQWNQMNSSEGYEHATDLARADILDQQLFRVFRDALPEAAANAAWETAGQELRLVGMVLSDLWELAEPHVKDMHRRGFRPGPIWD